MIVEKQSYDSSTVKLIYKAYDIIGDLTPINNIDCGGLCNKICCMGDDAGMLLFPGEEAIFDGISGFCIEETEYMDTSGLKLILCGNKCERALRPLACRIFPASPNVDKDGNITVQSDMRGRRMCPIWNLEGVDKVFVESVNNAFRALAVNQEMLSFMRLLSSEQEKLRRIYKKRIPASQ